VTPPCYPTVQDRLTTHARSLREMETREAYAIPYPSIPKRSGFRTTHYIASQGSCDTVRREEREPEPGRILGRGARIAVCATRHLHHILEENRDPLAGRPTGLLPYRVTGRGNPPCWEHSASYSSY